MNEKNRDINNGITSSEIIVSNIRDIRFDDVWQGNASSKLNESLDLVIDKFEKEKVKVEQFSIALSKLDDYMENKDLIAKYKQFVNMFINQSNTDTLNDYSDKIKYYNYEISTLTSTNEVLKLEIEEIINDIVSGYDFVIDIKGFKTINLEQLSAVVMNNYQDEIPFEPLSIYGGNLYDLYNKVDENGNIIEGSGREYVNGIIDSVKEQYSGGEAAAYTFAVLIQLAADKGVKIRYTHDNGTTEANPQLPTDMVVKGTDCCAAVSWAVNNGSPKGFHWRYVGAFEECGEVISDLVNVKVGDVFVRADGNSSVDVTNHVGMIIANDVENGKLILAQSTGPGMIISECSYEEYLKDHPGYSIIDMSSVYNGTADEKIYTM